VVIMQAGTWFRVGTALLATALWAAIASADLFDPTHCDNGIGEDEKPGPTAFPRGDVFCPTIADPKSEGTFASYLFSTASSSFGSDIGSVGIGDRLGIFRYNGPRLGEGIQFGLQGNVFAQFDMTTPSKDLVNADYMVGFPVTMRRGPVSARLRVYHQSSHLGDEFLLDTPVERVNLSFESSEGLLSLEVGPLRAYGGGEYLFHRYPTDLKPTVAHGGLELRQGAWRSPTKSHAPIRIVAAVDAKSADENNWAMSWSARGGFEVGHPVGNEDRSRRWSVLYEYYYGPSPYGQFLHEHVAYSGVGLHLGI
jgi:hypothetical protein